MSEQKFQICSLGLLASGSTLYFWDQAAMRSSGAVNASVVWLVWIVVWLPHVRKQVVFNSSQLTVFLCLTSPHNRCSSCVQRFENYLSKYRYENMVFVEIFHSINHLDDLVWSYLGPCEHLCRTFQSRVSEARAAAGAGSPTEYGKQGLRKRVSRVQHGVLRGLVRLTGVSKHSVVECHG